MRTEIMDVRTALFCLTGNTDTLSLSLSPYLSLFLSLPLKRRRHQSENEVFSFFFVITHTEFTTVRDDSTRETNILSCIHHSHIVPNTCQRREKSVPYWSSHRNNDSKRWCIRSAMGFVTYVEIDYARLQLNIKFLITPEFGCHTGRTILRKPNPICRTL